MKAATTPDPNQLLEVLLNISLTGVILFRPVYSPDGTRIIDLAYVQLNPAAQQMLKLPECPADTFLSLYPHALHTGIFAFYRDTFLSGKAGRYDLNYSHDGLDNYFHLSAQPSGGLLVVSFTDTAEQPRTAVEVALRESQHREKAARQALEHFNRELQDVFEQAPVGISICRGPEQVVAVANPGILELWDKTRQAALGKPLFEVLPELRGQGFDALIEGVLQTGIPVVAQEHSAVLLRQGKLETGYFNFVYHPLRNERGQISGVVTVATEVTSLVRARQQVHALNEELATANRELKASNQEIQSANQDLIRAQQALQQLNLELDGRVSKRTQELALARAEAERQRQVLYTLFMQAPTPIVILDGADLVFQLVNPAYQQIFPGRTLLNKALLEALPELTHTPIPALLNQVYRTGETFVAQEMPLLLARHEGGPLEEMYFTFTYQARRNDRGAIDGVLVFASEVTEAVLARRRIEESARQVNMSNQQLESANQQLLTINHDLDTFVYTASHDLKAPIANIEGLLKALEKQIGPAVLHQEIVGQLYGLLYASVNRFKATIRDLTEVSRISKESTEDVAIIGLAGLLEEVLQDLEPQRQEACAGLEIKLHCPSVLFSRKNLKSVLYNLLSNAIKYRSPERAPLIRVTCNTQAGYQVLSVQDNGLGMDMRQEEKIFALFKRLHTHVEGTGIGLYIVKRVIENAGGKIEVESQVGVGSTFNVYFKR